MDLLVEIFFTVLHFFNVHISSRYYFRHFSLHFFFNNFSHSSGFASYVLADNLQIYTASPYSFHNLQAEFSPGSRHPFLYGRTAITMNFICAKPSPVLSLQICSKPLHFSTNRIMTFKSTSLKIFIIFNAFIHTFK